MASQVKVAKPEGENNHKNEEQAGKYFKIYLYDTLYTVAKFGEKWLLWLIRLGRVLPVFWLAHCLGYLNWGSAEVHMPPVIEA